MHSTKNKTYVPKSPALTLSIIALSIILSEILAMLVLHYWRVESVLAEIFADILLLFIFISPALYFFLFQPMANHIRLRQHAEDLLLKNKEEQLKSIISASQDGFWVTDMRGRFLEVNEAYCRMVGYSQQELLNMGISDVEAVETPEDTARHIGELMEMGSVRFETRHRHRDGHLLDIDISSNYSEIDGGHIYCFLHDITERKQSEELIRNNEARLQATLDNSPYMIWQKDADGRYIAFNRPFIKTTGKEQPEDVLGKTDFDIWPKALAEKYRADDAVVIRSRKQVITEERAVNNGQAYWVETCKTPIIDKMGKVLGTTGFAQDITERKRAETKVKYLAHYDTLTNLPNRILFNDRLQQALP